MIRGLVSTAVLLAGLAQVPPVQTARSADPLTLPGAADRVYDKEFLRVERGAGMTPLVVPKAEELDYDVVVDLGIFGETTAGKVVLASGVEPYFTGLPPAKDAKATGKEWMGYVQSIASGEQFTYKLHQELKTRLLPQAFPSIYYTDTQTGTENRRRELKLGLQSGKYIDQFRDDGHCHGCTNAEHFVDSRWIWGKASHCDGCKKAEHRVWWPYEVRELPPGTVDMLSAVYLARSMVRDGRKQEDLNLVDQMRLWNVNLSIGESKRIRVPAGEFECVEVRLRSTLPAGETPPKRGFVGLFGLRGTIQIWIDAKSGVPVQIQGEFPITLISTNLDIYVRLKTFRGTPPSFAPLK